jgi:hypothetical protein
MKEGDAMALGLREGGRCSGTVPAWRRKMRRRCMRASSREMQQRCAYVKEDACGIAASASVRSEMRYDLRRDKDTLVGCLLG